MKALIVDSIVLYKKDNIYYSPSIYSNSFFERYISVYSRIKVVAKVIKTRTTDNLIPLDTEDIEIVEIQPYRGLKQLSCCFIKIARRYKHIGDDCDCAILKVVQLESIFAVLFGRLKKPYGVEVVNDPLSLNNKNIVVKLVSVCAMKYFVRHAKGVSYITRYVLQEKYPCYGMTKAGKKKGFFYTNYPTLDLHIDKSVQPRKYVGIFNPMHILHVANVIVDDSKGQTTLLKAARRCILRGLNVEIIIVGEGKYVETLRMMSEKLDIAENIRFVGRIADHNKLMDYYRGADLFVFPSRSEGQGRVNLEAQSVGLPCLASNVGGIVELFDKQYLFNPYDYVGFADKIIHLAKHPEEMEEMSRKNILNARKFDCSVSSKKRTDFYRAIYEWNNRNVNEF